MKFWLLLLFAATAWAQVNAPQTPAEKQIDAKLSPSLQPVADVPGLPRVLLIGDSVSMGYTLRVRAALQGRANVHRVPTNAGPSSKGVAEIDRWLGDGKWDVIHFNFGLHDVRLLKPDEINVPRDRYEANLRAIVARLQRTGATLIWATTTPAPPKPRAGQYPRNPDDITAYNAIAARVMAEHGVRTNDLHAAVLPRIRELQPEDDVHFNAQGSDVLGAQVAAAIGVVLPAREGARIGPLPTAEPKITQVEPRVWSCEYESRTLGLPMRFLVVLPEGATRTSAPLPTIYFLHGRGRHERSLFEYESTRQRVLASPCAVVLPRGRDGWYVNSPVIPADRYADHLDEVMALAELHFPVGRGARARAIGGWSMGGYGAAYTAARRGDFAAVAPIIGILDYPRAPVADPGQNYALQPRFGTDPAVWRKLNPRAMVARLREIPLFVAYADKAAERQMNEDFIADARAAGGSVEVLRMSGGHTFPMVEQGLPAAFAFLEKHLAARRAEGRPAAEGAPTLVRSIEALRPHLARNGTRVKLAPGTYRLESAGAENFLPFTGSDSHFDFTGVRFEVDTAQFARIKAGINLLLLTGDRIVLEGLELETIGNRPPPGGCRAISVLGRGVVVRDVSLRLSGSYPYGYGSFFGIGSEASINPQKQNGIRIGGIDNQVINCRVVMRCFGHAIFLRGAQNALVRDCTVEGALRATDEILAEKAGPAFELGFKQYTGAPIPAGEMTSLSEDGIRAYPNDPETGRRTRDIRVENCRVTRMRRGICLAYASGRNSVTGCEVTESERVAYHVQSDTVIRDSRGDALYSQVLDISTAGAKQSDVELTVLDSRGFYGHAVLATLNGSGHAVTLREAGPGFVPAALSVDLGQARSGPGEPAAASRAAGLMLSNFTRAEVILHPTASGCTVASAGPVTDRGKGNRVSRSPAAEAPAPR